MASWRRPVVIIVYRLTMKAHDRRWPLKRSACWICTVSERFIDREEAGHDVTEMLGAAKESPASPVWETRDEGHESAGQGPAGEKEGKEAETLVDVFVMRRGLGSNLLWTLTNWLISRLNRIELRQEIAWLAASSKAIVQACLLNNGIVVYRYHVNRGDISVIYRSLEFPNFVIQF